MKSFPLKRTQSAFSLVELLVVIAVIGVLAAILLPVIGMIRARSGLIECTTNLRQMGLAVRLYANDHSGYLPGPLWGGQEAYYPAVQSGQILGYLDEYIEIPTTAEDPPRARIMICPTFAEIISEPLARCYVMTSVVKMLDGSLKRPFGYPGSEELGRDDASPVNIMQIDSPESAWVMQDLDKIGTSGYRGNPLTPETAVHGDVRNTLFFDGHVEALPSNP